MWSLDYDTRFLAMKIVTVFSLTVIFMGVYSIVLAELYALVGISGDTNLFEYMVFNLDLILLPFIAYSFWRCKLVDKYVDWLVK